MKNRSLEEFVDGGSDRENEKSDTGDEGAGETLGDADGDRAEPAVSTSRWDGSGVSCSACGDTAHRVWNSGSRLVCGECKDWG